MLSFIIFVVVIIYIVATTDKYAHRNRYSDKLNKRIDDAHRRRLLIDKLNSLDELATDTTEQVDRTSDTIPVINNPALYVSEDFMFISPEAKATYLRSPQWQDLRNRRLSIANHCCELCSSPESLNLHHVDYSFLTEERIGDVVVLCRNCHQKQHDHYGYDRVTCYLPLKD